MPEVCDYRTETKPGNRFGCDCALLVVSAEGVTEDFCQRGACPHFQHGLPTPQRRSVQNRRRAAFPELGGEPIREVPRPCANFGEPLTGQQRVALRLSHTKLWAECRAGRGVAKPDGKHYVCPCDFCPPEHDCPKYEAEE